MTTVQCEHIPFWSDNMRFEQILFVSMASIFGRISDLRGSSIAHVTSTGSSTDVTMANSSSRTIANDTSTANTGDQSVENGLEIKSNSTTRGASDVFGCLVKQWHSNVSVWDRCHDVFSSYWNEDARDYEISERKKSKYKNLDLQTLMLGASIKLILFLPILAVLTGKAMSLSLMSLLISSIAFLYKT